MAVFVTTYFKHYYITVIIASLGILSEAQIGDIGPTDRQILEGTENEFIPCPYAAPFWRINSSIYYITRLPLPFQASSNPSGIVIPVVERSISGTSFQCLTFVSSPGNARTVNTSTGVIYVIPVDGYQPTEQEVEPEIEITHQRLLFTSSDVVIPWGVFIGANLSTSTYLSSVGRGNCDPDSTSYTSNISESLFTVSRQQFDSSTYFTISGESTEDESTYTIAERFRFMSNVNTVDTNPVYEGSICRQCIINVTEESEFFALPRSPTSTKPDFLCLAYHTQEDMEDCFDLAHHCGVNDSTFDSTIYSPSLEVCGTPEMMCFSNVTHKMNNTKFNFFASAVSSCPALPSQRAESRLYVASYNLVTQVKVGDYNVTVTPSGSICFNSLQAECFLGTVYNMTIYDRTGYLSSSQENIADSICISLLNLTDECSPFEVVVDAYHPHVSYNETKYLTFNNSDNETDNCRCAYNKIKPNILILNVTKTDSTVTVPFRCDGSNITRMFLNFHLVFYITEKNYSEIFNFCSHESRRFVAENLQCGTRYFLSVSAYFKFPNQDTVTCNIFDNVITTESCSGDSCDATCIALAVVIPVIFVVIICGAIAVAVYIWKKRKQSNPAKIHESTTYYNSEKAAPKTEETSLNESVTSPPEAKQE